MKHPQSIQISIPNPCHEDWNKMTPQEQGRYCASCRKCVVDFTGFSDAQLYRFIDAHKGQKICGRFKSSQLNRQINIPHQPHSTLYKWMIAAGLALMFIAAPEGKTFAQAPLSENNDAGKTKQLTTGSIQGTIFGDLNQAVVGAKIKIYQAGKELYSLSSDYDGFYSKRLPSGRYDVFVEATGYRRKMTEAAIITDDRITEVKVWLYSSTDTSIDVSVYQTPTIEKFGHYSTTYITGKIAPGIAEPIKKPNFIKRIWRRIF